MEILLNEMSDTKEDVDFRLSLKKLKQYLNVSETDPLNPVKLMQAASGTDYNRDHSSNNYFRRCSTMYTEAINKLDEYIT